MKNKLFSLLSCLGDFNIVKTGENRLVFVEKAPEPQPEAAPKSDDKAKSDAKGAEAAAADAKEKGAKEVAEADPIKKVWPEDLAKAAKTGAAAPKGEVSVSVKTRLNFRGEGGVVVKGLNNGDKLKVEGDKVYEIAGHDFIKVTSGGKTGYVALKYTSTEKGTSAPAGTLNSAPETAAKSKEGKGGSKPEAVATGPAASPAATPAPKPAAAPAEKGTKSAPAPKETYGTYIKPKDLKKIAKPTQADSPQMIDRNPAKKVDEAEFGEVLVIKRDTTVDRVLLKEGTPVVVVKRKPDGGKKAESYIIRTADGVDHELNTNVFRLVKTPKKGEVSELTRLKTTEFDIATSRLEDAKDGDRRAMRTWQAKLLKDIEITQEGSTITMRKGETVGIYENENGYQLTYGGKKYNVSKSSLELDTETVIDTRFTEAEHYGLLAPDSVIIGVGQRTGVQERLSTTNRELLVAVTGESPDGYKVVTQSGTEGYVKKSGIKYIVKKSSEGEASDKIEERIRALAEEKPEEKFGR